MIGKEYRVRILFLISAFFYGMAGILGNFGYEYLEINSLKVVTSKLLIPLILFSLFTGIVFFSFFRKAFPNSYNKQNKAAKVLILIMSMLLSFGLNRGGLIFYNGTFGKQTLLEISGFVNEKYFKKGSRDGKTFYVSISDSQTGKNYHFKVKGNTYYLGPDQDEFLRKNFYIGSLGIIYRSE